MSDQVHPRPVTIDAGMVEAVEARIRQLADRLQETWGQPFQVRDSLYLGLKEAADEIQALPQLGAMVYGTPAPLTFMARLLPWARITGWGVGLLLLLAWTARLV